MRRLRTVLVALAAVAVVLGLVTLIALEGRGVAVLHTTGPDGQQHRTRVWYAESGGALWIESATTERPFYTDLAARRELKVELRSSAFDRDPVSFPATAELVAEPGGHERIRQLLAERYGWADCWIALLQDTSSSRAVTIHRLPAGSGAAQSGVTQSGRPKDLREPAVPVRKDEPEDR